MVDWREVEQREAARGRTSQPCVRKKPGQLTLIPKPNQRRDSPFCFDNATRTKSSPSPSPQLGCSAADFAPAATIELHEDRSSMAHSDLKPAGVALRVDCQILGHAHSVDCLLCADEFIASGSTDTTIKVTDSPRVIRIFINFCCRYGTVRGTAASAPSPVIPTASTVLR